MPNFCNNINVAFSRREFFGRFALGLGGAALTTLINHDAGAAASPSAPNAFKGNLDQPHLAPKAKRIIYLFMSSGPSQHDLVDHKPLHNKTNGKPLPTR